ncbi:MAG: DUF423 domain-containing protein [Rhodospirillales bacterium]|nr:DUF423 domain-containing protein [Rhodospirillales bacterium]MDP6804423.1 DUF423 domain-containing protein [Rhodospirillales bacterium]
MTPSPSMPDAARLWLALGALNGLLALAAAAFGRHGLAVSESGLREVFMIGVDVHMWHALALLAVAALAARCGLRPEAGEARAPNSGTLNVAGGAFVSGIILFSGPLYVRGLTGETLLAGTAPLGGSLLFAGWAALIWAAVKGR